MRFYSPFRASEYAHGELHDQGVGQLVLERADGTVGVHLTGENPLVPARHGHGAEICLVVVCGSGGRQRINVSVEHLKAGLAVRTRLPDLAGPGIDARPAGARVKTIDDLGTGVRVAAIAVGVVAGLRTGDARSESPPMSDRSKAVVDVESPAVYGVVACRCKIMSRC